MRAFNLSKNSLHYRVAAVYGPHSKYDDDDTDLCSYLRAFLKGLFVIVMITGVGGIFIGGLLGSFLAWLAFITVNGFIGPSEVAFAGGLLLGMALLLIATLATVEMGGMRRVKYAVRSAVDFLTPERKDTFLQLAYRSFKDKTCVKLTLE